MQREAVLFVKFNYSRCGRIADYHFCPPLVGYHTAFRKLYLAIPREPTSRVVSETSGAGQRFIRRIAVNDITITC